MVARQNVAARSLAVQQVAIAAHLSAAPAEISRSGTPCRVTLPLQFTRPRYTILIPWLFYHPSPAPPLRRSAEDIFMAVLVVLSVLAQRGTGRPELDPLVLSV